MATEKRKTSLMRLIGEQVIQMTQDFQRSSNATLRLENATIKMSPSNHQVESRYRLSSKKTGTVYLPRPSCIISGKLASLPTHLFSAKVWEFDVSTGSPKYEWKGARISGHLQLSHLGGNKWIANYKLSNQDDLKVVSEDEAKLNVPAELVLEPCKGTEDEDLINELRKQLT